MSKYKLLLQNKIFIAFATVGISVLLIAIFFFVPKLLNNQKKSNVLSEKISAGILVINTNKMQYLSGEKMLISLASFDDTFHTLCDSNLKLEVVDPEEQTQTLTVVKSSTCGDNSITNDPDYSSSYNLRGAGQYKLKLTNLDNKTIADKEVEVKEKLSFDVNRSGATRVNPSGSNRYPMIITVKAGADYRGQIKETIPAGIKIVWQGPAKIEGQNLVWDVNLKAGETITLSYEYRAPETDSQLYKLGPIYLNGQNMENYWQIVAAKIIK